MSTVEKAIRLYAWKTNYQTFRIVQGEIDSRTFNIQLFSTIIPVDLTNCSVMLYAVKPDSTVVYIDCEVLDAANGLVSVTLSEQMAAVEGTVDCWVQVVGEGGTDLRFEGMNLEVGECNLSEKVRSADEMKAFLQQSARLVSVENEVRNARMGKSSLQEKEAAQDAAVTAASASLRNEMASADNSLEQSINVQKSRIDNLVANAGNTDGNAELIDIRTDVSGYIHETAGEAVRAQVSSLTTKVIKKLDADMMQEFTVGRNIFSRSTLFREYIDNDGIVHPSEHLCCTDYIDVSKHVGDTIYFSNNGVSVRARFVSAYDENLNYIQSASAGASEYAGSTYIVVEGVHFIRITYKPEDFPKFQAEYGEITPFDCYGYSLGPITSILDKLEPCVHYDRAIDISRRIEYSGGTWRNDIVSCPLESGRYVVDVTDMIKTDIQNVVVEYVGGKDDLSLRILTIYQPGTYILDIKEEQSGNVEVRMLLSTHVEPPVGEYGYDVVFYPVNTPVIHSGALGFTKSAYEIEQAIMYCYNNDVDWVTRPNAFEAEFDSLNAGEIYELQNHIDVKNNKSLAFFANVNNFGSVIIGHGKTSYGGGYVVVDGTNVSVYQYTTGASLTKQVEHGLNISGFISIVVDVEVKAKITLTSVGGSFVLDDVSWTGSNGAVFAECVVGTLTGCKMNWTSTMLNSDVWVFGDSYLGLTSQERYPYYILQMGYDKWLACGYPGSGTTAQLNSFVNLMTIGKPKYAVWTLGMNNPDSDSAINSTYLTDTNQFISICAENNVVPILATIPTTPGTTAGDSDVTSVRNNEFKNDYVRSCGCRYIDLAVAVGAQPDGSWYDRMISGDKIHPSAYGAKAMAARFVLDVPEIRNRK